jgi:2-dehydro-3-deoxyglucarate aldolase
VSQRSNRYGSVPDYFRLVNDNIALMVQIESRAGVAAAASIAAVDGVDGLFIGPSDLAAAYGYLGAAGHPEVQEAMTQVFAAVKAAGKPVGILAPVEADARRYMQAGATFVAVGSDLGVLRMATQALRDNYRDADASPIAAQY